jgi:hypothetical protein
VVSLVPLLVVSTVQSGMSRRLTRFGKRISHFRDIRQVCSGISSSIRAALPADALRARDHHERTDRMYSLAVNTPPQRLVYQWVEVL